MTKLPPRELRPLCRHCKGRPFCRPLGLCHSCSRKPAVRALYPSTSKFAVKGVGLGYSRSPLPDDPVPFPPGSEGKILAMIDRVKRRQSLFHPDDR